jgi:hypothetical protein
MSNAEINIVSGLPRSGTSLMMQMLDAGGLKALTDNVRSGDEDNPRGYFELEAVTGPPAASSRWCTSCSTTFPWTERIGSSS